MMELVQWCSLFCSGNEAQGDLTVEFEGQSVSLPICEDCLEVVRKDPSKTLDLVPGVMLEFDPEESALSLLPDTKE